MPPSEMTLDSTEKNLNNNEVRQCIDELKLLVTAAPLTIRTDDEYLLRYLHFTDFKVMEAYKKMQVVYELRLEYFDWFCHTPPTDYMNLMDMNVKAVLDGRDREGRRIYLTKMGNLDTNKTNLMQLAQFDDLWFESILDEPETQENGVCCIMDMSGYSWKMFKWLTPSNVKICTKCTDNMPIKRLVFHIVNSSMLLNAAVSVTFPFMSSKMKENIFFHYQNWSSLHQHIDPKYLPEEYGGMKKIRDFTDMNKWLMDQTPRLLENFKNDCRIKEI